MFVYYLQSFTSSTCCPTGSESSFGRNDDRAAPSPGEAVDDGTQDQEDEPMDQEDPTERDSFHSGIEP